MHPPHLGVLAVLSHVLTRAQAIHPLPAQAQGTFRDGKRLAGHKPALVTNGSTITFGTLAQNYVVECETTGAETWAQDLQMAPLGQSIWCTIWPSSHAIFEVGD